jgi:RHS repeat-associated protein
LKFSGKERESGSEIDYFGARYYGHKQYRFLSVDPVINKDEALANPQLWNLYSYCRNNPVTYFDPDGNREVNGQLQIEIKYVDQWQNIPGNGNGFKGSARVLPKLNLKGEMKFDKSSSEFYLEWTLNMKLDVYLERGANEFIRNHELDHVGDMTKFYIKMKGNLTNDESSGSIKQMKSIRGLAREVVKSEYDWARIISTIWQDTKKDIVGPGNH